MSAGLKDFFKNILYGFLIGFAFVIPGFSGGTIAVIVGIYDKLISSITNIFKKFKESIIFLLPILIGMVLAFAALIVPITLALEHIPLPTICLFVGLMLGGMPVVMEKARGIPESKVHFTGNIAAGLAAFCVAAGIGFLSSDFLTPVLSSAMVFSDWLLLFFVCFIAACALVVPGISGSMIMMVFGYYTPLMNIIKNLFDGFGHNILVLGVAAIGIIAGFFVISFLMRFLLKKFPRGTYYAIIGFIIGSVITLFYAGAAGKFSFEFSLVPWQIALAVILGVIGFAASFIFYFITKKREAAIDSHKSDIDAEGGQKKD